MNGFPLGGRHSLRVQVHRSLNVRVPQQFLLHSHVCTRVMQNRRERVPERVPADLAYPGTHGRRLDLPVKDAIQVSGPLS